MVRDMFQSSRFGSKKSRFLLVFLQEQQVDEGGYVPCWLLTDGLVFVAHFPEWPSTPSKACKVWIEAYNMDDGSESGPRGGWSAVCDLFTSGQERSSTALGQRRPHFYHAPGRHRGGGIKMTLEDSGESLQARAAYLFVCMRTGRPCSAGQHLATGRQ